MVVRLTLLSESVQNMTGEDLRKDFGCHFIREHIFEVFQINNLDQDQIKMDPTFVARWIVR